MFGAGPEEASGKAIVGAAFLRLVVEMQPLNIPLEYGTFLDSTKHSNFVQKVKVMQNTQQTPEHAMLQNRVIKHLQKQQNAFPHSLKRKNENVNGFQNPPARPKRVGGRLKDMHPRAEFIRAPGPHRRSSLHIRSCLRWVRQSVGHLHNLRSVSGGRDVSRLQRHRLGLRSNGFGEDLHYGHRPRHSYATRAAGNDPQSSGAAIRFDHQDQSS